MGGKMMTEAERLFTLAISKQVEEARESAKVSRAELAAKIGVSAPMLYNYINGEARWSPFRLRLIADFLGVPVQCFIPKKVYVNTDVASS
jgi:transcriptional regulator with XRE-family HTH domain